VRTAQFPRWRIRFLEHHNDNGQKGGDFHASGARGRMHPAEVTDAVPFDRLRALSGVETAVPAAARAGDNGA